MKPEIIAFDADDTLWKNESLFHETEIRYCELLADFLPAQQISEELFKTEMQNLHIYGYGTKSFTLSMIETALRISGGKIDSNLIHTIIGYGKSLLNAPVELLPGIEEVLDSLYPKYRLVVATKGDLLDQERKLRESGLKRYFHHVEIMSDKQTADYIKLLKNLNCSAEKFMMIGNSVKSDILPVLELGGQAVYIPFEVTWAHEKTKEEIVNTRFRKLERIEQILDTLS